MNALYYFSHPRFCAWAAALIALFAGNAVVSQPAQPSPAESPMIWKHLGTDMAVSITQGWRQTRDNLSVSGQPLRIAGQRFERGLGTHAPGVMVFKLDRQHRRFMAFVGVDDGGDARGSVVFEVLLDGKKAFHSGVMKHGQAAKHIDLALTGVTELRLIVTDAGDGPGGDHADWAEAAIDSFVAAKPVRQFSTAGFFTVANSPRAVLNFNPGWRFLKGDVGGGRATGF